MKAILVPALLGFACAAHAQYVTVKGTLDCGKWIEARQVKQAEVLEAFIQGYANGLAVGKGFDFWEVGGQITPEQVFYWVDNYCGNNPLNDFLQAISALFSERGFKW